SCLCYILVQEKLLRMERLVKELYFENMRGKQPWMEARPVLADVLRTRLALTREVSTAEIVIPQFVKKPTSICWALADAAVKTKMVIDKDVATAVKNFLLNYVEVHGLPSP
ncbi:178_t:CDS:2, partial [Acaulospora morrowiae]